MDTEIQCGIGRFKPNCLQCCATMKIFTVFYSISALMTSTLSVYIASQITTIEKQFGFTSTQSGILMSCNDIGYLAVTLFVSYFADKVHGPRVLSFSTLSFGVAGIICAIPYFVSPMYSKSILPKTSNGSQSGDFFAKMISSGQLCEASSNFDQSNSNMSCSSNSHTSVGVANEFTPVAMAIIAVGMILQGIGKSPRQAFITTYIDNNVKKTQTAVYVGSVMAVAIFGPALGFGLGGLFSKIYVTLEDVDISPRDPRWIGAWWIGFLTFGLGSILTGLPVMCFPKRFHVKQNNVNTKVVKKKRKTRIIEEFFKDIYGLLRNKLYVLIIVGRCLILILVGGSVAFGPKYIETQFTLPAWKSNLVIGVTRIIAVSVGTFIGGYLTSKKRISPLGCGRLIVILSFLTIVHYLIQLFLGCPTPKIIGYDRNISNSSEICTSSCNCNSEGYFPVCGSDNNNYFSPCHAGCSSLSASQGFSNCTCIGQSATAKPGLCSTDCQMLVPYLVVTCVFSLIESLVIMPSFIFMLRSVKDNQKGIAIAFSAFITTLLGWFLGPVIFGEIIDMCCKIWSSRCGVKGSCALYNNVNFRYAVYGFSLIMRCIVLIIDIIAYLIARKKTDWSTGETRRESKVDLPEKQSFIVDEGDTNGHNSYIKTILEHKDIKETKNLS
ncbi:solute carrier organic anion transporter family, member 3A [Mytilus galloprovincialis]|uniref:Solute carrier organic anion transporter family member n=1 Tax=Mytilus galloprovincialis TaxID=29158 RepID=A0A8B6HG83_MYTGA|nr:solute carrier organic anion transporter family, member 3A [Mytilus galloprovincialis]